MRMTIAEKILARASGRDSLRPGEIVTARIDRTRLSDHRVPEYHKALRELGINSVWNPDRVTALIEHNAPASTLTHADAHVDCRAFVEEYGIKHFYEVGRGGICHTLFIEQGFARPGELVAACDSHTCTYGALNVASRGLGIDDMIYVLAKGETWFRVPETIRFHLKGRLPERTSAKDIILHIAGTYGNDCALYKSIEFLGEGAADLNLWSRVTMSNMGIDLGAKFALFEADEKTISYVKARTDEPFTPVESDRDAAVWAEHEIDLAKLEPLVACPYALSNVKPAGELKDVSVQQCFLGSCNSGSIDDFRIAARYLKGKKVHPKTRLIVIPGSMAVYRQMLQEGILEILLDAGAAIESPTCGPCNGSCKGLLGHGERALSTTNRNNKGRQGSKTSETYLASMDTVAASAVTGKITDPRTADCA